MYTGRVFSRNHLTLRSYWSSSCGMLCMRGTKPWRTSTNTFVGWFVCSKFNARSTLTKLQETRVINTSDMSLTQELHIIRAHQLHYSSLLDDFKKIVEFVRTTKNPAMDALDEAVRKESADLMDRECNYLLSEIKRLEMGRRMQDKRLKNVMNLVCLTRTSTTMILLIISYY